MSFFIREKCFCLKWRFKLLIAILLFAFLYYGFKNIYSILAPQQNVNADILVVEAWLSDYALEESLSLFRSGEYQQMLVTGGPLNYGYYLTDFRSTADAATETLFLIGASPDSTISVSRELVWRDRTYHTALKLKEFLQENNPEVTSFNLVSQGAHGARSWLLYKMAMPEYEIGIVSIDEKLYDQNKWWKTSKGFRTVVTEAIGYFYIRCFFKPY